ncbi:membrane protein insertase YidC [Lysobacter sp. Root494]|uniref:membrane protein insertase YidC n=1 Tax=Lysobacter sp. Root494 TaxID=1736549 RepID=UPI0006F7397D|nr:membrane protein insertase YidC [Lysobacter sp. Root494]KQY49290.1 insertase [Lysobacter sp. Root494]
MNQTRLFLIFAWLMVATLLWMEWGKEKAAPAAPAAVAESSNAVAPTAGAVPGVPTGVPTGAVPSAPATATTPTTSAAPAQAAAVTVTTDVLRVVLDGGELRQADLLKYPSEADANSPPVRLFADDAAHFFVAQSGWVSNSGTAPSHQGAFVPADGGRDFKLGGDAREIVVPFVWSGANGMTIHRNYVFQRGSYVVQVRDQVANAGNAPWQGYVYRQLIRVPRALSRKGPMSAESYSFQGAAWFSPTDKYEKCKYDKFADDCDLNKQVNGGWIGMLQHHFFAAWIPGANDTSTFSLATPSANGTPQYLIREVGPGVNVAPGAQAETSARLWVGPKLVKQIEAQNVPGLDRAVDFSSYGWAATLAGWLFWVLEKLHNLLGNWGWAIVGLVVIIKALMYPLSAAQYRSMAKMRRFQPRIKQLQERYGDDKQKLQMAMMELYKKEKINPVGGCFPILLQMPVFLCLYWMLSESVELRHAPWIAWIADLTARDPYFILPAINLGVMWLTQKLAPQAPGMDPMQQKMMQFMPLVFGVLFAFMPAGLVLYWITNGSLGLLQQWWMTKRYAEEPARATA